MLDVLTGFVQELREAGVPVSMVEAIDAMEALGFTDLADRAAFKAALGATLVKNARHYEAFEIAFEVYFALDRSSQWGDDQPPRHLRGESAPTPDAEGAGGGGGQEALMGALMAALAADDLGQLRRVAKMAVDQLAGMERGRPVGGTYYLYRTLRQLSVDDILDQLVTAALEATEDPLDRRLRTEELEARVDRFREEVRAEIRRRLVADRGRRAVAKTLRKPLLEDLDLMHATRIELGLVEQAVAPLTRKLASRLAQKGKRHRRGRLDFRKTVRRSLATGGVPVEPIFRNPHPSRPEVFLLCDISGSMATFARFTLQFVYAMSEQFSRLRSFVFVDALDEATRFFDAGVEFDAALEAVSTEAEVVWLDGHSDYGNSLEMFWDRYGGDLTPRSTVIISGDARNNYRNARGEVLGRIAQEVRAVYWLNPEPRGYWDTGDSVMKAYAPYCHEVREVRNLRQLETFIETLTVPTIRNARHRPPVDSIG